MTEDRIKYLSEWLKYYQQQYYAGTPQISDQDYDKLEDELRALDPGNAALQQVGAAVYGQKVEHARPMLSLEKVRTSGEVFSWMDGETCVVTHKMDGSAASLVFKNKQLAVAKTRGDGKVGENITEHVKCINCPQDDLPDCEIRGEICISGVKFAALTDEMLRRGLEKPNSIRNIVAGLLHRKDNIDLCAYLDFIAYDFILDNDEFHSENEKFHELRNLGFLLPAYEFVTSDEEIDNYLQKYQDDDSKQFLTDGVVFSLNILSKQKERGTTNHHPKGKLAFKFPSEVRQTTVKDIEVDVGRTGKLTFVGIVEPVELSGAQVGRVTLHNLKYIRDHKINIGCTIEITRSGEVIPKHVRTVTEYGEYRAPLACPACGGSLEWTETGVDLVCTGLNCPAQLLGKVSNWISKVGIDGIGDSTLETLHERGWVENIHDLYLLDPLLISQIEGFGDKSAENIVNNVQMHKNIPISKFLPALGLQGLGNGVSKLILDKYPTISEVLSLKYDELLEISGIGDVLAKSLSVNVRTYIPVILKNLSEVGVKVIDGERPKEGIFTGKSFVITGTLSRGRNEIESWIVLRGGKCSSSVSKKTSYLVCNEPSTSSKYTKAEKLGTPIITEDELYEAERDISES